MARPSFFVIGAPKAATTALYHALRRPVDRAFAHWSHFRAAGGEPIADFAEAVRHEGPRREAGFAFTYRHLECRRYSKQLPAFLERFGRDRLRAHLIDDLCADPDAVVRATARFLDLDDSRAVPPVERHDEMPAPRFQPLRRAHDGKGGDRTGRFTYEHGRLEALSVGPLTGRRA